MPDLNPFLDVRPFNQVILGGHKILAGLVGLNGHKLELEWNIQKGTNTSGATAAYRGIKLLEGVTLTFECAKSNDSTAAQQWADLMVVKKMLLPTARLGLDGPKPPTLRIENALLNGAGLTNINLKDWLEYPTETNSWKVDMTVIQYSPPAPAGAGAQDPSKPATGLPGATVDPQIAALRAERDKLLQQAIGV